MPVRVGIGGWTFAPWRDNFYPARWPQARELEYASGQLGAIEINATFHGTQKPASFARWREQTPEGFVFSVKAHRFVTHRRVLAEAGESVERFVGSGIAELGEKLGPILWQLPATKAFDADDLAAFFALLPAEHRGLALRHVLEPRHPSFVCEAYVALARRHRIATVFADSDDHPSFADLTGGFVYARMMKSSPKLKTGYGPAALKRWVDAAQRWASGEDPADLPHAAAPARNARRSPRDVFVFFINGAKERAPAAALALQKLLAKA